MGHSPDSYRDRDAQQAQGKPAERKRTTKVRAASKLEASLQGKRTLIPASAEFSHQQRDRRRPLGQESLASVPKQQQRQQKPASVYVRDESAAEHPTRQPNGKARQVLMGGCVKQSVTRLGQET